MMTSIHTFVLCILFLSVIAQNEYNRSCYYKEYLAKESAIRYRICFFIVAFFLIFVAGFRYYVGTDFGGYYKAVPTKVELITRFRELDEPIVWTITFFVRSLINDGIAVIFVESLITVGLVFYGIWQYDEGDIVITTLLYIFAGSYGFGFNAVRQAMAAALMFAFSKKAQKHWVMKYVIVVFVAFLIHKSAIFMFPVFILAQRRFDFKQMMILGASSYILPTVFEYFFEFMDVVEDNAYTLHQINSLRILVAFAPVALIILASRNEEFVDKYSFLMNMIFINALLILTTANSALINRLSYYTMIFIPVLLPKFKHLFKTRQDVAVFLAIVVVLYYIFWRYELGVNFVYTWSFGHFGQY